MRRNRAFKIALATVATGIAIYWTEPWAPRFEGRTVEAWLKAFVMNRSVDQRVVNGFGTNATPRLLRVIHRQQTSNEFRQDFGEIFSAVGMEGLSGHQRAVAAGTWLSWLKANGNLLQEQSFPVKVNKWLDIWDDTFWAPRWVQLVITTPDESAAARTEFDQLEAMASPEIENFLK